MPITINIETFRSIFKTYYNPLVNFAAKIIGKKTAEDVVQEVFVNFWEKRSELVIDSPKSLLFRSVYNKCIEKIRTEKVESKHLEVIKAKWSNEQLIEDSADIFMLREKINNSLRQLPPKCREVFELSKLNGLTYREIAKELNISEKTVENHMLNAFKKLRSLLSDSL